MRVIHSVKMAFCYVLLAPGDLYIQSPAHGQVVHAVINIGYCGVSQCAGLCAESSEGACSGIITAHGGHYWHAKFMVDSVTSALRELQHGEVTNSDPQSTLPQYFRQILKLMEHCPDYWGTESTRDELKEQIKVSHLIVRHRRTNYLKVYLALC